MMDPPQQDVYAVNPRLDVAPFVPRDVSSVADIGCAGGGFGATLRSLLPDARIVGVEAMPAQASLARASQSYDRVVEGYFPDALQREPERFDLLVFNDVLEHMVDPWQILGQASAVLHPGGRVLASLPNIQYAPVVVRLLRGRWDYVDEGVLDRTHLRFFTRSTMIEMFESSGFDVESCIGIHPVGEGWGSDPRLAKRWASKILTRLPGHGRYVQYVLVARAR